MRKVARTFGSMSPAKYLSSARPGQVFQMLLRGFSRRHRFVRILIAQLVERKVDAVGKPHGFRDRIRDVAKQPRHFLRRLEMAFGIGFKPLADRIDGGLLADAGQHILQRTARGIVIQHLVGREQFDMGGAGDVMQPAQAAPVVAAIQQARGKPHAIRAACAATDQEFSGRRALSKRCGSVRIRSWPSANCRRSSSVRRQSPFSVLSSSLPRLPWVSSWHSRP